MTSKAAIEFSMFATNLYLGIPHKIGIERATIEAAKICKLAYKYHIVMENFCNGFKSASDENKNCLLQDELESKIRKIAAMFECGVTFQGDPRGCCVRFTMKNGAFNSFVGDMTYCVPIGK